MQAKFPCRKCGIKLNPDNSGANQWKNGVYICRECDRKQHKELRERKAEHFNKKSREWKAKNKDKVLSSTANYRERNRSKLRESGKKYYQNNKARLSQNRKEWCQSLKEEVLSHYSTGTPSCTRCNFSDIRALSIDHINGEGSKHRRELKGGGARMYQWLKANHYPAGYQVLCMNCQFIKKIENDESRKTATCR